MHLGLKLSELHFHQLKIGTYSWPGGKEYTGEFHKGMMHGKGEHFWASGKVYKGDFKEGNQHKNICLTSHFKDLSILTFVLELPDGQGVMTWPDGRKYEGMFKEGKQHGKGTYTDKHGKSRKARFENGKKVEWLD